MNEDRGRLGTSARSGDLRFGGSQGATAVEYALIVALVAVVIIVAVALLGTRLSALLSGAADSLDGATVATLPGAPGLAGVNYQDSRGREATRLIFSAPDGGDPITGFIVQRANERGGNSCAGVTWNSFNGSATSPLDTGRRQDDCWRVAAVNGVGQGPWSSSLYYNPA